MANTPKFTAPLPKDARPYLIAKLKANAPTSVAAFTGTASNAAVTISSATGPQVAAALAQLLIDLRSTGIIL